MDRERAQIILSRLADGVDPRTGEVFPRTSPYQHAEVVRALYVAINDIKASRSASQETKVFDFDIEERTTVYSRVVVRATNAKKARQKVILGEWASIEETDRDVDRRDIVSASCRECGEDLDLDGWDGLCGNCADAAEDAS